MPEDDKYNDIELTRIFKDITLSLEKNFKRISKLEKKIFHDYGGDLNKIEDAAIIQIELVKKISELDKGVHETIHRTIMNKEVLREFLRCYNDEYFCNQEWYENQLEKLDKKEYIGSLNDPQCFEATNLGVLKRERKKDGERFKKAEDVKITLIRKDGEIDVEEMSNKNLYREESNNDILPPSKPSEPKKVSSLRKRLFDDWNKYTKEELGKLHGEKEPTEDYDINEIREYVKTKGYFLVIMADLEVDLVQYAENWKKDTFDHPKAKEGDGYWVFMEFYNRIIKLKEKYLGKEEDKE